ncbi:MAG: hypothetical protein P0Y65_05925 [Candidatus Devosia phytovorans]|uniref:Uncharacterized protein n=1 Tax=Candidatus Devosia phytovorans TaxID=3121372 RepID=A0AAJ5VYD2_9HYPH|nr:hypothetical protein [Devosia sp.]WEK05793.1 MAG: hypothetical protein P0Y65_05925 [Devosia sp.]
MDEDLPTSDVTRRYVVEADIDQSFQVVDRGTGRTAVFQGVMLCAMKRRAAEQQADFLNDLGDADTDD